MFHGVIVGRRVEAAGLAVVIVDVTLVLDGAGLVTRLDHTHARSVTQIFCGQNKNIVNFITEIFLLEK